MHDGKPLEFCRRQEAVGAAVAAYFPGSKDGGHVQGAQGIPPGLQPAVQERRKERIAGADRIHDRAGGDSGHNLLRPAAFGEQSAGGAEADDLDGGIVAAADGFDPGCAGM